MHINTDESGRSEDFRGLAIDSTHENAKPKPFFVSSMNKKLGAARV
jgi:hypothetical protein